MPDKNKKHNDPWYEIAGAKRPDDPWYEIAGAKRPEKKEPRNFNEAVEMGLAKEQAKASPMLVPGSAEYMVKKLMDVAKLNKTAAIGAVANLYAESKLDHTAKQKLSGGKIGRGRGLAQWETGGRWDTDRNNLLKYAKSKGVDPFDKKRGADIQLGFIGHEMDNIKQFGRVRDEMNKAKTVVEATNIFLKKYEKAGIPHKNVRLDYARELEKKINALPNF